MNCILHLRFGAALTLIWMDRQTDGQPRNLLTYKPIGGCAQSREGSDRTDGFGGNIIPSCLHTVSGSGGVKVQGVSAIPLRADPSQAAHSTYEAAGVRPSARRVEPRAGRRRRFPRWDRGNRR